MTNAIPPPGKAGRSLPYFLLERMKNVIRLARTFFRSDSVGLDKQMPENDKQLVNITHGYITFKIGQTTYQFEGEAYLPGSSSPNFDIDADNVWELSADGKRKRVATSERDQLISILCEQLDANKITYEIQRPRESNR